MRNLIIITSIVFIAIIITSYVYFSNLEDRGVQPEQDDVEITDIEEVPEAAESSSYPTLLWTFALTAAPVSKPVVFSLDDNHRIILIQDAYHILYAISEAGEKLWNAQLPGPIIGHVHQSGDGNLLFTTAERLYYIDRTGDPLPGFSLRLPQKASDEGATIAEENNGTIRIDVRAGKRILSYNDRGRLLQTRNSSRKNTGTDDNATVPANRNEPEWVTCGPLSYYGPLLDEDTDYLLCGNEGKLFCYRGN